MSRTTCHTPSPWPWRRGDATVDHVNGGTFFPIYDSQGAWIGDVRLRANADVIVHAAEAMHDFHNALLNVPIRDARALLGQEQCEYPTTDQASHSTGPCTLPRGHGGRHNLLTDD
jgi:hypothetical protein